MWWLKVVVSVYFDWPCGEDYVVTGERTYGVIDGATPVGGSRSVLLDYVRRFAFYLIKYENVPLRESVEYALRVTASPELSGLPPEELPSAAAAVVRVFDDRVEGFRAEDSVIGVEFSSGDFMFYSDSRVGELDSRAWGVLVDGLRDGKPFDEAYEDARKVIGMNREKIGVEYFPLYPGADAGRFYWYGWGRDEVKRFFIMSDGFYRYFELFGGAVEDVLSLGPVEVLRRLRELERRADRGVFEKPFFKVHDDATLVVVEL